MSPLVRHRPARRHLVRAARALALAGALAGCERQAAAPPARTAAGSAGSAGSAAPALACPPADEAARLLQRALSTPEPIRVLACATGAFPAPALAFIAWEGAGGADGQGVANVHHAIVGADGQLVAAALRPASEAERADTEHTTVLRTEAADLDADGDDEWLVESELARRDGATGSLDVYVLDGKALRNLGPLQTSLREGADDGDDAAAPGSACRATWKLVVHGAGLGLELTSTEARGPAAPRCLQGTAAYDLRGGALVRR